MKLPVLVVVQCRFNSRRLPGKVLYPIAGIPLLVFLLKRLQTGLPQADYQIVLATSTDQSDDILAIWAAEQGVHIFRGSEQDVLNRYRACWEQYPAEIVVRVTADNPLTCPGMLQWLVQQTHRTGVDYAQIVNLPYGAGVDLFSAELLQRLDQEAIAPDEREHLNLRIYRNKEKYHSYFGQVEGELARPDLRMTVDTKEDWERMRAIFDPGEPEPWRISLAEAIIRLDSSASAR
jgi:spore coat polysaccharide biosynthesis protein SpsF